MANYGQPLFLDQCDTCGGIWFDRIGIVQSKAGRAEKVDLIDTYILTESTPAVNPVHCCPKDGAKLSRFTDANFPSGIIVERCRYAMASGSIAGNLPGSHMRGEKCCAPKRAYAEEKSYKTILR